MKSSYKQLLSDTVVFGVGNALMKLVQFCLMPIYTAYMTTEQYGVGELINNLNELLYPLACLAIYDAVFRFALDDDGQKKSVLSSGLALTVISLPIVLVAASISFFVFHFSYVPPGCFSHDYKCSTNEMELQDEFFSRPIPYFPP